MTVPVPMKLALGSHGKTKRSYRQEDFVVVPVRLLHHRHLDPSPCLWDEMATVQNRTEQKGQGRAKQSRTEQGKAEQSRR